MNIAVMKVVTVLLFVWRHLQYFYNGSDLIKPSSHIACALRQRLWGGLTPKYKWYDTKCLSCIYEFSVELCKD